MDKEPKPFLEAAQPSVHLECRVNLLLRGHSRQAQPCNNTKLDPKSEARLPCASVSKSRLQSVQEICKLSVLVLLCSTLARFSIGGLLLQTTNRRVAKRLSQSAKILSKAQMMGRGDEESVPIAE